MKKKERLKNISKKSKVLLVSSICVALAFGGYLMTQKTSTDTDSVVGGVNNSVETYTIPDNEKIFINGSIKPKQSKDISLEPGYEVSDLKVSSGQTVKKGATLFTSKNNEYLTQISDLEQHLKDLNTQKNQLGSDSVDSTLINSEIRKANNEIKSLKDKSHITVTAPFDGKVYLNDSSDEQASPSYMTVEDSQFYMTGQVSEQDLPKLTIDMPVSIYVFATEGNLTGKITSILDRPSTSTDSMVGSGSSLSYYDVTIDFDTQENLTNGFHIQASVNVDNVSRKIPTSAIVEDKEKNKTYVFKVMGGILKKQIIEVESKTDDFAVVKSGLKQNDSIVKYPTDTMSEGDAVSEDTINAPVTKEGK